MFTADSEPSCSNVAQRICTVFIFLNQQMSGTQIQKPPQVHPPQVQPMHTQTHTHAHTQTHTCTHTQTHTHRHTQTHTDTHIHTHRHTHAHTQTPTPPYTHTHIHALTTPPSTRLVTMTMMCTFFSHTMCQNSTAVIGSGPCVAMYSLGQL